MGRFAVQFARAARARVYATVSGDGVALVRGLGADVVIDRRAKSSTRVAQGVDVVLDTVGGETRGRSFAASRPGGHLVSTVLPLDEAARARGVSASVVSLTRSLGGARFRTVVDEVQEGPIRVLTDRTLPLEQFGEALGHQRSGRARGKIILTVG